MKNLNEGSRSYHEEADVYERFSLAEDTPRRILPFLKRVTKGKHVLDLGCGNGRYAQLLAPTTRSYCGLDSSPQQIAKAVERTNSVRFVLASADKNPLPDFSFHVVIATWVIGTIQGVDRRFEALSEAERVLRPGGSIYLVENDAGSEFERIRGRFPDARKTLAYNRWLMKMGFKPVERIATWFDFESLEEAKRVIGAIWGKRAADLVQDKKIEHTVVIYCKKKTP